MIKSVAVFLFAYFFACPAWSSVRLPSVFGNNMVLQQNSDVKMWGTAAPGEDIALTASWGAELKVEAAENGKWSVEVPTPSGSHVPHQIILRSENIIVLSNILIGEVWLCSGQSNMGWSVQISDRSYQTIKNASNPSIRFFNVPNTLDWEPQDDVAARWEICSPETVPGQSAVAYLFGKELLDVLDVPIGLIVSAWGGSDAQAWIDRESAGDLGLQNIVDWYSRYEETLRQRHLEYTKDLAEWRAGQPAEGPFDWDTRPERAMPADQHIPFALYNGMIHPIQPYTIKGAIWYQGESNVSRAHQYRTLFPAMIRSWRRIWDQGDFPFYYVQIAPFHYNDYHGVKAAELRDAQLKTLDLIPNTGMVVTTDVGNINDIHPRKKQPVSNRLARLALHNDYGKTGEEYSSPLYDSYAVEDGRIVVSFSHAGTLKVRGEEIIGFTIAGKDQRFVPADAQIVEGNRIEVWSDDVRKPVAVRFGWSNIAVTNVFNEVGLPVSPFKTDDWKDTTEGELYLDYP